MSYLVRPPSPAAARRVFAALLLSILFGCVQVRAQTGSSATFALKTGDRVVFYGDSITAQRLYTKYVEESIIARYPGMHIDFYNAGMGGDRVSGGGAGTSMERLERDVVPFHPTVVTIMLGMNDGGYTADYSKNFEAYSTGYRRLLAAFQQDFPAARFTLIGTSPYDEQAHAPLITGYNDVLVRYGDFNASLAKEKGLAYVDFNLPTTTAVSAAMRQSALLTAGFLPDRVHPSPQAHWLLAAALLHAWNFDPLVSSVTLDVPHAQAVVKLNSTISDIAKTNGGIRWTQLDRALPLPLEMRDPSIALVVEAADLSSLDQQMLRAIGLNPGHYTLTIDGTKIGTFTHTELETGVNLALMETPMLYQARSIDWSGEDRAKLNATRFNMSYQGSGIPNAAVAVEALNQLDKTLTEGEHRNAQPKPHQFELVPE
jgi:lysophospholipase L1-like esterase